MNRANRKSGLSLTAATFEALHKALIVQVKERYKISPETIVDYQLYGFNKYDKNLPSIKKLVLERTDQWVNGKYLYNKHREWKKGAHIITLTREFVFIYFKTLGYRDVRDFIMNSSLSEVAIAEQINLEKPISVNLQNEYYVGYYLGEESNVICTRLFLSEHNLKVRWVLAYWEKEENYSEYVYDGIIQYQQNGMNFIFKNEDTILDRCLFITIFCERQLLVKPFLVGAYSGYDRNRQPVIGEVIFQRVSSAEEQIRIIESNKVNPIISQHISGRRWLVSGKTLQSLTDLSPESKFADEIAGLINNFRGLFVSIENGVFVVELSILDNLGNATLKIAGHPFYKGTFKVQASGQLLIGKFTNPTTQAPLFMSIEILPIRAHTYRGDMLGVSRFDKSFSGKIFLSSQPKLKQKLPKYRGSELTLSEIKSLPKSILIDLNTTLKNTKLEEYLQLKDSSKDHNYIQHLRGTYRVYDKSKSSTTHVAILSINENGEATLSIDHLNYEGSAMVCEGATLSIYFTRCNGIPHCGQILGHIGRKRKNNLSKFNAKWLHLDEHFEAKTTEVTIQSTA